MKTLRRRLYRLEGKRDAVSAGPYIILLCDAITGEPGAALLRGGGGLTREAGETSEAFIARVSATS